ncbi:putative methyltransferase-domain-containing protein [Pseudomassariella vexata]|uniref:Putative methyltransferase-domain-containing protein n=1 Tax=Pseudomassariella vexata TaxID=1141098 RepID=A0A1Y2EA88_9PEZI|nr:putative methyltransferase-domain-containing protein [Pseudomassariella vexata]ORY67775.1 putative methyltransferase-domain-containing protein [Pseudomassariella vexata]
MTMELKKKAYHIPKSEDEKVSIDIAEADCQAEGLVLTTWTSSFILSNQIHKIKIDHSQLHSDAYSVLELGAGTGLTGLSTACIWGTKTLLTDLPTIVPGLQVNVDLNANILGREGASAACGTLDWNQPDTIHMHSPGGDDDGKTIKMTEDNKFPVILAADTMYTEEHPKLISRTVAKCLRRSSNARFIICYAMRIAYIDPIREFWGLMEEEGLVVEQEGREEIDLKEWDDEKLHEWAVFKWGDL